MVTNAQAKNLVKAIDKFNNEYGVYVRETEQTELPSIDCTCIGWDPAVPYTYQVLKTRIKVTDCDGNRYTVENDYDLHMVKDSLHYDRRRLSKAWRIWKSDNPDWELEHDIEEE